MEPRQTSQNGTCDVLFPFLILQLDPKKSGSFPNLGFSLPFRALRPGVGPCFGVVLLARLGALETEGKLHMKIDSESWASNVECCWLLVDLNFWSKSFSCIETTACFVVFLIFSCGGTCCTTMVYVNGCHSEATMVMQLSTATNLGLVESRMLWYFLETRSDLLLVCFFEGYIIWNVVVSHLI